MAAVEAEDEAVLIGAPRTRVSSSKHAISTLDCVLGRSRLLCAYGASSPHQSQPASKSSRTVGGRAPPSPAAPLAARTSMSHSPQEKRRASDVESYTNTDADSVGQQIEREKANDIKYRSVVSCLGTCPSGFLTSR
jgi:hypothetical protein